ncbi:DUF2490 domain-containing protein [Tellurirhabdus bombi]|uniref:DUF2490 domain-containing protein n=1 Tax=Tellurirhabdus bombi TaxID=2907205 RepID=UPI001F491C05|nr:DUF2490 domain-containing protein [Tellurirhabdus bombi]
MKKVGLVLGCWLVSFFACGQANRLLDHNQIGWYLYNGDHVIHKKWTLHTEYQWRRIDFIKTWQQSLARLGFLYSLTDQAQVGGGYTFFTTYPYGTFPVADLGVPTPEHRTYQDVQWDNELGRLALTHRLRLEQRWLGQPASRGNRRIADWEYQNRARYQLEGRFPLQGPAIEDGEFYLTFLDELFISFGKNVGQNVFNQNRILGGVGYQFQDSFMIELGYLNQITQHADPDPLTGKSVFEFNNGFRLNVVYSLDFTK